MFRPPPSEFFFRVFPKHLMFKIAAKIPLGRGTERGFRVFESQEKGVWGVSETKGGVGGVCETR